MEITDMDNLIEYVCLETTSENTVVDPQTKQNTWTKAETLQLIDTYEQYMDSFNHAKQRKHAWAMVSTHLQAINVMKSTTDCSNKWNNLLRTYKACKDNIHKSERRPIRFEFFQQMDVILGKKYSNAEAGLAGRSVGITTTSNEILENLEGNSKENSEPTPAKRSNKKRLSAKEQFYKLKIDKLVRREQREEEFLKIEKRKLDLIQKLAERL